jgi:hypothetical protein
MQLLLEVKGNYNCRWTRKFLSLMLNRLHMGSYRYKDKHRTGDLDAHLANIREIQRRLDFYRNDSNTNHLVAIANFALLEFDSENREPVPHDRSL